MGRKKLNRTIEEQRIITNERRMRYYNKHKRIERQRALERYYRRKSLRNIQDSK